MKKSEVVTVEDAKIYLRESVDSGEAVKCPCCDKTVKFYKRRIHGTMARFLIHLYWMHEESQLEYFHADDIAYGVSKKGAYDLSKLRYWKMIENKPQDPADKSKKSSGYWKITEIGRKFVLNQIAVPKYVIEYHAKRRDFDGPNVSIKDCIPKGFHYGDLMSR